MKKVISLSLATMMILTMLSSVGFLGASADTLTPVDTFTSKSVYVESPSGTTATTAGFSAKEDVSAKFICLSTVHSISCKTDFYETTRPADMSSYQTTGCVKLSVLSNQTGTLKVQLQNSSYNAYAVNVTIAQANVWQVVTVSLAGCPSNIITGVAMLNVICTLADNQSLWVTDMPVYTADPGTGYTTPPVNPAAPLPPQLLTTQKGSNSYKESGSLTTAYDSTNGIFQVAFSAVTAYKIWWYNTAIDLTYYAGTGVVKFAAMSNETGTFGAAFTNSYDAGGKSCSITKARTWQVFTIPLSALSASKLNAVNRFEIASQFDSNQSAAAGRTLWITNAQIWSSDPGNAYTAPTVNPIAAPSITAAAVSDNSLTAQIANPMTGASYQVWAYTSVTAGDISDASGIVQGKAQCQWVLQPKPSGDTYSISGAVPDSGGHYSLILMETDNSGNLTYSNFASCAVTPGNTGHAKIQKVLANGIPAGCSLKVNAGDSSANKITFQIVADNAAASGYSLTYGSSAQQTSVDPVSGEPDTFVLDTSSVPVGSYAVVASAAGTDGEKDIVSLRLYVYTTKDTSSIDFPQISGIDPSFDKDQANQLTLTLSGLTTLNETLASKTGLRYLYTLAEPGCGALYTYISDTPSQTIPIRPGEYGYYLAYAQVGRSVSLANDDAALGYVNYARPGGSVTLNSFTASVDNGAATGSTIQSAFTRQTIKFAASTAPINIGSNTIQYSYWRQDANDWVQLRGWSGDPTLQWVPARPGKYVIQVRARGSDAGSYESAQNIIFSIASSDGLALAQGNPVLATSGSTAREPVRLSGSVTGGSTNDTILYQYSVWDQNLNTQIVRPYSPDPNCDWVPRKAGSYTVTLQIINQNSFGIADNSVSKLVIIN